MVLPVIVHVDVSPAVVDEAALDHRVRRALDPVLRNRAGKTIPTVPAHRRRQRNLVANDDAEFFHRRAERILRDQCHDITARRLRRTGKQVAALGIRRCRHRLWQRAGDAAGLGIQLQSRRQIFRGKGHGPVAGRRNRVKERRSGPHAENVRAVDARRGRRGRREEVGGGGRVPVGGAKMDGAAKAKGGKQA